MFNNDKLLSLLSLNILLQAFFYTNDINIIYYVIERYFTYFNACNRSLII